MRLNELAQEEFEDAEEFRQHLEAVMASSDYDEQNTVYGLVDFCDVRG
jgi:hypothetical protein